MGGSGEAVRLLETVTVLAELGDVREKRPETTRLPHMEKKTQIAKLCIQNAKKTLGDGWGHVSHEVQWGLVSSNLLGVLQAQDESISDARFRTIFNEVSEETRRLFEHSGKNT